MIIHGNQYGGSVVIGDQIASAAPTATGSADLVSAATNVGGIIITSLSMSSNAIGSGGTTSTELSFVYDGNVIMKVNCRGLYNPPAQTFSATALGGFCNIEIPAGKAVGYAFSANDGGHYSYIYISWRHK